MAKLVAVYEENDEINLGRRQLPLSVYDTKIMTMQLGESCGGCEFNGKRKNDDSFTGQYNALSKTEVAAALVVPSKVLFTRLAQTVACVGCRRSVERLFNQLKESGHPALEPLVITSNGILTVQRKYSLQPKMLANLFANHGLSLSVILDNIPKLKKSGRCLLHSMEGVRCSKAGGRAWREVWDIMDTQCREAVTLVCADTLLTTLDNYLRKHRFCHECKNKVHRAFDILVGGVNIDRSKEKGYVASLYAGIKRCEAKRHIHIPPDTDYITHIITRAEPELQGRRERHAKTLEIAQEEVLTCVGLFLHDRLQRIHTRMKEEEQTWDILFHVALDALSSSFQLYVEDKQGYSKFEMLCEELQRQELKEKAKKEKKKKKKKNKKNEEGKENSCLCEDDDGGCRECELNMASSCSSQRPTLINATNKQVVCESFCRGGTHLGAPPGPHLPNGTSNSSSEQTTPRCGSECDSIETSDVSSERGSSEEKDTCTSSSCDSSPHLYHHNHNHHHHHHHPHHHPHHHNHNINLHKQHHMECSASTDSLVSRCSQSSRDGGYCSAHNSGGSSRDSSEVACGDGLCYHPTSIIQHNDDDDDDDDVHGHHNCDNNNVDVINEHDDDEDDDVVDSELSSPSLPRQPFTLSLQQMLDDSRCEEEDEIIPEAEVRAWRARLGAVREKRAELRQTLRQRFQQFCHRGEDGPGEDDDEDVMDGHQHSHHHFTNSYIV